MPPCRRRGRKKAGRHFRSRAVGGPGRSSPARERQMRQGGKRALPPPGAEEGRAAFPQPRQICHCEPVLTLAWQSVLFYVFAGGDLRRAKPISLFVLPKRETAFDVKEKRALVGGGEPRGKAGVAACGRTIRGAPAVRSVAARSGPVRFPPRTAPAARLCRRASAVACHSERSEESPGQNAAASDLSLRGSAHTAVAIRFSPWPRLSYALPRRTASGGRIATPACGLARNDRGTGIVRKTGGSFDSAALRSG